MATRMEGLVLQTLDRDGQARFWLDALGYRVTYQDDDEIDLGPQEGEPGIEICLVVDPGVGPKTRQNRLHLDLTSRSAEHQAELVDRLLAAGASHADVGQGDVPWVVLRDPEGNELCVLEPREEPAGERSGRHRGAPCARPRGRGGLLARGVRLAAGRGP
ncbi:hypothetical protein GCM10025868_15250 [Angustibacter aerolatus]|uniref:VOC domain-containing protein n=1 Tax=Angustibacter aerolatus TaxID=1162965 RepID=A0ABQ6JHF8_9ACTN|nr:VOC family protein [Angustibacter aerolatus]GMA86275.1 hypothetical protein GCM10025868_15250 [Angustibacter aerolatus]